MFTRMETTPDAADEAPPLALRWQWARLPELGAVTLYAVLAARQDVFTVEQRCAFRDADGHDLHAWHLLGWGGATAATELAAYLRVVDPQRRYAEPSIGRVLTVASHRGKGLGRVLMREGIARARHAWPGRRIRLAAQQRLVAFYASLGFVTVSAPYDEDGITHIDMALDAG